MDTKTAYTPLECLLVFQSLAALGTDDEDFIHISEMLNNSPLIRNCPSYDARRLEASALRELYLRLLQDELKAEEQDAQDQIQQSVSRKRKLPSSKVPSVNDFRQYRHKLPLLVERLYARYRDYMIKSIEEDERRFIKVQGQIKQIERGDWNDRIQEEVGNVQKHDKNTPLSRRNGKFQKPPKFENGSSSLKDSAKLSSSSERNSVELATGNSSFDPELCSSPSHVVEGTPVGSYISPISKRTNVKLQKSTKSSTQSSNDRKCVPSSTHIGRALSYQCNSSESKSSEISPQPLNELPKKPVSISSANTTPISPIYRPTLEIILPSSTEVRSLGISDTSGDITHQQDCTPASSVTDTNNKTSDPSVPSSNSIDRQSNSLNPNCQQTTSHLSKISTLKIPNSRQKPPPKPLSQPESKQYSSPYNTSQVSGPSTPLAPSTTSSIVKSSPQPNKTLASSSHESRRVITGCGTSWNPTPTGLTPRNLKPLPPPKMEPLSPIRKPSTACIKISSNKQACKRENSELNELLIQNRKQNKTGGPTPSDTDEFSKSELPLSEANTRVSYQGSGVDFKLEIIDPISPEDIDDKIVKSSPIHNKSKSLSSIDRITKRKRERKTGIKSQPPSSVLWTKAFPKISAQALQDISTDKNASMFANPVKEKDAPGYRSVILRPQDLKSIRSAIIAGHRAALAIAHADLDPSATNVWLPISEDLIPPKGIINYAQFEKELMRMFANAIMFNADPRRGLGPAWQDAIERSKEEAHGYSFDEDSVVKGTRDMFAAVEKKVSDLRSVERRNEESWNTALIREQANDDEDDSSCSNESHNKENEIMMKRRKKA